MRDINFTGSIDAAGFINIIQGFSPLLMSEVDCIKQIAHDFMVPGDLNSVNYLGFIQRLEQEIGKQNSIKRIFIGLN
jgi:hypothetical protein